MKPDKFIDAMGNIDDSLIDEYQKAGKISRAPVFMKIATLAASVAVVLSASLLIWHHGSTDPSAPPSTDTVITDTPAPDDTPHITHENFKIVSVSAKKKTGSFVSGDTSFVVKTEHGTAEDVRTHLFISTAPEYTVTEIAEETFEVRLSGAIADNTVVSLSYVKDGIIDHSWAFQTEGKLSLSESYPADGATTVPVNSVIELEFSYSSAEGVEGAVTFEPEIAGSWEHAGRVWRFTPAEPLAKDSTYKIYVEKGITAEGKELDKTSTVTFSTFEERAPYSCSADIITVDGINSYLPSGDITLRYVDNSEKRASIGHVAIEKFATYTDMISFAEGETVYTSEHYCDAQFSIETVRYSATSSTLNLTLTDSMPQGYYVARVYAEDETHLFDWIIQVHPLSLYASVTERDILVWIAKDGELAEGVKVEFGKHKGVTDKDGILLMEDVTDGSGEIKYLFAGDENEPFVVGTPSFSHDNYPASYIYTDKPKYKSTDTIKVWGMIPLDLFYDEPDGKFEVVLGSETDTAVEVKPDENGTFECEIEVLRHADTSTNIYLEYNGTVIGSRQIDIHDYSLNNYTFESIVEKDFTEYGGDLEFKVKLKHVSGITVSGKKLCASLGYGDNNLELFAETDESGIATFIITEENYADKVASSDRDLGSVTTFSFSVRNANAGDDYRDTHSVKMYILNSDGIATYKHLDSDTVRIQSHYLDLESEMLLGNNKNFTYTDDITKLSFCGDPFEGTVTANATVLKTTRPVIEAKYDELSKTNYPVYSNDSDDYTTEVIETYEITAKLKDGEAILDFSEYTLPESTESEQYRMSVSITADMPEENTYSLHLGYFKANYFLDTKNTDSYQNGIATYGPGVKNPLELSTEYFMYEYSFDIKQYEKYSTNYLERGDTIDVALTRYDGTAADGGKILYFIYGQNVREMHISDSTEFDITVGDSAFPHASIGGVYFKDGVFHRVAKSGLAYGQDERKLDIGITPDKEEYAPGDKVTVTVDLSAEMLMPGSTLKDTAVNVCVVNEAVYTYWDGIDILGTIMDGTETRDYFYSSYRDYSLIYGPYGWGGGGGHEADFSDTVYFGSAVTDENGKCTVTFILPEDRVTSYRITVHAANRELYAGSATANIEAVSDFFLQPGEIKHAKAADDLAISATLITAEPDTAQVTFRLNELGMEQTVPAKSGESVFANFGKIPAGDYTVTVSALSDTGDPEKTHKITFPVTVEISTMKITEEHTADATDKTVFTPAVSPVTLKLMTEEAERYYRYIRFAEEVYSDRLDTVIGWHLSDAVYQKLAGGTGGTSQISVSEYKIYAETSRENLLALLPDGEGDPVLTALYAYLTGETYYSAKLSSAASEADIVEGLLNRAAAGEAVLVDLLYAKDKVSDDPYTRILLSLALSISGDTHTAAEVLLPLGEDATDGDRALYAMALVFTDRAAAARELDLLVEADPSETYLSLATVIYMRTGEKQIGKESLVTVLCGDREIPVSVKGLETKNLVLSVNEGDTVSFKDSDGDIRVSYSYEATFIPKEDERNIRGLSVSVNEAELFKSTDLTVDLSSVVARDGEWNGTVKVALPNCFREDSNGTSNESNIVSVRANEENSTVTIPLIAVAPGNYILEPVIFTLDGVNYYSEAIEITIE